MRIEKLMVIRTSEEITKLKILCFSYVKNTFQFELLDYIIALSLLLLLYAINTDGVGCVIDL